MRLCSVFLLAYLQIAVCVVMHTNTNTLYVQMEPDRPLNPPRGWVLSGCAPREVIVKGRFVFQNPDGYEALKAKLLDISDPCSPNYGKWLTRDQVDRITALPPSQVNTVQKYLQDNGVDCHNESLGPSGIQFSGTVDQMEKILHTELKIYVTNDTVEVKEVIRIHNSYYLPTEVAEAVLLEGAATVFPLNYYPSYGESDFNYGVMRWPGLIEAKTKSLQRADWNSSCGQYCQGLWTPDALRKRYHISSDVRSRYAPADDKIGIAVASFTSNYFDPDDQSQFADNCGESVEATSVNHNDPTWCKKGWNECSEGNLDTELCAALTQPTYEKLYVFDNYVEFYEWATDMNALDLLPQVISVSYGSNEEDSSSAYKHAVNFELLKLAARGVTLVFASGDVGAYGIPDDPQNLIFNTPIFPASSPWVLSVGGTALAEPKESAPEVCSSYSGGGFSSFFDRPQYQSQVIDSYSQTYGKTSRGYPDVSAIYGSDIPYCIYNWNQWGKTGGTSASAPVIASIIALLNQIRANFGGPRLGFINPYLYWLSQHNQGLFTDITDGTNKAWGTQGFPAQAGWDACSGLGSVRFDKFRTLIEEFEHNGYPQCYPHPSTTTAVPTTTTPTPTTTTQTPTTTTTTPCPTTTTPTPTPTTTTPTPTTTTPTPTTTTTTPPPTTTTTTPPPTTTTTTTSPPTTTPVPTTTTYAPTTTTAPTTTYRTYYNGYYNFLTPAPTTTTRKPAYIGESIEKIQPNPINHLRSEILSTLTDES